LSKPGDELIRVLAIIVTPYWPLTLCYANIGCLILELQIEVAVDGSKGHHAEELSCIHDFLFKNKK
jgi:hypothetical protein